MIRHASVLLLPPATIFGGLRDGRQRKWSVAAFLLGNWAAMLPAIPFRVARWVGTSLGRPARASGTKGLQAASLLLPVLGTVLLLGCGGKGPVPDVIAQNSDTVSLDSQSWYILYSEGMGDHPSPASDGSWSIALPDTQGSVNYVQTPFRASVPHKLLSITFRVHSSGGAVYNGRVDPDSADPATFHLFLERRGDDLTDKNYRWWSKEGGYVLGSADNTTLTIAVPLTSDKWTNVHGEHNDAEFKKTLDNLGWVGITFGGSNYWGHGVNMKTGASEFELIDYRVQ